jgi:hypothetical protein
MAKNRQHHRGGKRQDPRRISARAPLEPAKAYVPKPIVQYGEPFMLLEDAAKNTFEYTGGAWVPFDRNIADCKIDCLVKELPQKVNKMTRYEVRCPVVE